MRAPTTIYMSDIMYPHDRAGAINESSTPVLSFIYMSSATRAGWRQIRRVAALATRAYVYVSALLSRLATAPVCVTPAPLPVTLRVASRYDICL